VIAKLGVKKTMLISDAARGSLMLVIPILHSTGHLSFAALLATTFAIGLVAAPYFASSRLVVSEVAGEDEQAVASVNAVLSGHPEGAAAEARGARNRPSRCRSSCSRPRRRGPVAAVIIGAFAFFKPLVNAPRSSGSSPCVRLRSSGRR
jgi:hypothetical protein